MIRIQQWNAALTAVVTISFFARSSFATNVSLVPAKDNTLIQWSADTPGLNPQMSNGAGDIFVGRTNQDGQEAPTISIRRGLVQFDVAGVVPDGMTIASVSLTMRDVMGLNGDPEVTLQRMLRDWGEGTSFFPGGQGASATEGDATWLYTSFNSAQPEMSDEWDTPGASTPDVDFDPDISSAAIVSDDLGGGQLFTWTGPDMVADVQSWLENPTANFGWMLKGDESRGQSAKRFNSGESTMSPNMPPALAIEYVFAGDYNDNGVVDAADYAAWRKFLGNPYSLNNELVTLGEATPEDYDVWSENFGEFLSGGGMSPERPVPEPASNGIAAVGVLLALVTGRHTKRSQTFHTKFPKSYYLQ